MRKPVIVFLALLGSLQTLKSQNTKPELLPEPANWEFERFSLPPSFAPAITYKGFEELRFAPGMFKKDSADYFTYIFVASTEEINNVSENDLLHYIEDYYKGLCASVAKDKKLSIDTSKVKATVHPIDAGPEGHPLFASTVNLFGVFADGAPVTLNLAIEVIQDPSAKRTILFFIASPQPTTSPTWKKLYELRTNFRTSIFKRNKLPGTS